MLISKLFTTEAILGTTSKFVLYPLSSSLVQMLYLEEDMLTEKYYTPLNSQRNWIKLKLFKHSYCQQRKCKCVCGTFSWHNMYVSVGLLTAAIEKKNAQSTDTFNCLCTYYFFHSVNGRDFLIYFIIITSHSPSFCNCSTVLRPILHGLP